MCLKILHQNISFLRNNDYYKKLSSSPHSLASPNIFAYHLNSQYNLYIISVLISIKNSMKYKIYKHFPRSILYRNEKCRRESSKKAFPHFVWILLNIFTKIPYFFASLEYVAILSTVPTYLIQVELSTNDYR